MVAIPEIPPEDSWFGNKNKDTPTAIMKEPIIVPIISVNNFLNFIIKITFIAVFAYIGDIILFLENFTVLKNIVFLLFIPPKSHYKFW